MELVFQRIKNNKPPEDFIDKCNHSHKKQKDSLETRAVLIEISMLCRKFPSVPKKQGSLLKNMVFSEGNQLFIGDFCVNPNKIGADMVQFTNRWEWEWIV